MAEIEGERAASQRLASAPGSNKEGILRASQLNGGQREQTSKLIWLTRRRLISHAVLGYEVMKQRLLTIDDDKTIIDALEMVLKAAGYDVISAQSGEAGLKSLSDLPVDLVLLDWQLPGIQGPEVLQKIREASHHLPVIIITAYDRPEMRQEIERLEVVAVIDKPFGPEDILPLIADALAEAQGSSDSLSEREG